MMSTYATPDVDVKNRISIIENTDFFHNSNFKIK